MPVAVTRSGDRAQLIEGLKAISGRKDRKLGLTVGEVTKPLFALEWGCIRDDGSCEEDVLLRNVMALGESPRARIISVEERGDSSAAVPR